MKMEMQMKTVNQVAKLTGVTVRTLHYYDEIGLLKPTNTTESGYRLYDDTDLLTLQQILFFKELDFSLDTIKSIIINEKYDKSSALANQKSLLIKKRNRLDRIINLVEKTLQGENDMSFKQFDMSDIEKAKQLYAEEVKQQWGNTDAYNESMKKANSYNENDWQNINKISNAIISEFASHVGESPDNREVQDLVLKWQEHITQSFYSCTNEILMSLGDMYISDERFMHNIDSFGAGTAKLMSEAIAIYCKK